MLKKGSKLNSILTGSCPKCQNESMYKEKNMFKLQKAFQMHEKCSNCGRTSNCSRILWPLRIKYAQRITFQCRKCLFAQIVTMGFEISTKRLDVFTPVTGIA